MTEDVDVEELISRLSKAPIPPLAPEKPVVPAEEIVQTYITALGQTVARATQPPAAEPEVEAPEYEVPDTDPNNPATVRPEDVGALGPVVNGMPLTQSDATDFLRRLGSAPADSWRELADRNAGH